jgi:hypothetical protein
MSEVFPNAQEKVPQIFPNAYAVFFVVQLVILMVVYIVLRFRVKLKVMNSVCLAVLIVATLTLLLLCIDARSIGSVTPADIQEYVTGTLVVAVPFLLILTIPFHVSLLREIKSIKKSVGPEKARILRMIEEGKITAEEGGDLLEAMGRSNALRGQDSFSRLDMAILGGVALVVVGFFLPWVHIRPSTLGMHNMLGLHSAYQAGYHSALGWTIFAMAIVSIIPVFVTPKSLLYKISIFHLFITLVGLLLVLITLLRAGSHLGIGIIICAVGFTIELIAAGAKFKRLAS